MYVYGCVACLNMPRRGPPVSVCPLGYIVALLPKNICMFMAVWLVLLCPAEGPRICLSACLSVRLPVVPCR